MYVLMLTCYWKKRTIKNYKNIRKSLYDNGPDFGTGIWNRTLIRIMAEDLQERLEDSKCHCRSCQHELG